MLQQMLEEHPGVSFTPQEIASYVGVDTTRVRQIENLAFAKLRKDKELWVMWKKIIRCSLENNSANTLESVSEPSEDGNKRDGCPGLKLEI